MSKTYPYAGVLLEDTKHHLQLSDIMRVTEKTGEDRAERPIEYISDMTPSSAYEFYEIEGQKYRLIETDSSAEDGAPAFMPYYKYHSADYERDAKSFLFRTHKKFEAVLKIVSTEDVSRRDHMAEILGGRPKSHEEFLSMLEKANVEFSDKSDGENLWQELLEKVVRVEQLALKITDSLSEKIHDTKTRLRANRAIAPKEVIREYESLFMDIIITLSQKVPLPSVANITQSDLRETLVEIVSEMGKAPLNKGRETMFFMNRASKIGGSIGCVNQYKKEVSENHPEVAKEFEELCDAKCRLMTIRRRVSDVYGRAKGNFMSKLEAYENAVEALPDGAQKRKLAEVSSEDGVIATMSKLRYPQKESTEFEIKKLSLTSQSHQSNLARS